MPRRLLLILPILLAFASPSFAQEPPEVRLSFLGDRFEPAELTVPTGVKFVLRLDNKASASMEFESTTLRREKVVPAGASATIFIGPLKPGSYEYYDDFHPKIRGMLVAR